MFKPKQYMRLAFVTIMPFSLSILAFAGDGSCSISLDEQTHNNQISNMSKEKTVITSYESEGKIIKYISEVVPGSIYYEECINGVLWKGTLYMDTVEASGKITGTRHYDVTFTGTLTANN